MSRRPLIALLAGLALAGGVLAASPAQAASYGVSLSLSRYSADVGHRIGISGKVTGKNAGRKTLTISSRLVGGSWKKAGTVTTSRSGTYSTKFTVRTAGQSELRVIAPRSGRVHTGTSPSVGFIALRWLDLFEEPSYTNGISIRGWNVQGWGTVLHGTPPRETFAIYNGDGPDEIHTTIGFRAEGQCLEVRATAAVPDAEASPLHVTVKGAQSQRYLVAPGDTAIIEQPLGAEEFFTFQRTEGDGHQYLLIEKPRAHCAVEHLPIPYDN